MVNNGKGEESMKQMIIVITIFAVLFFGSLQTLADSSSPVPEKSSIQSEVQSVQGREVKPPVSDQTKPDTIKHPEEKPVDTIEDIVAEEKEGETLQIADPLYPWNKAMYHFNDKFYFWLLKPVAKGYSKVFPEDIRLGVSNFFENITTPIRFVSSLLQFKMKDAGNELLRFVYNSTAGIGGLADAAKMDFEIKRKEEDIGQAFGSYGIGHGFYLVWPFLGPSSLRDTVGYIGDLFLNPVSYVSPPEASLAITSYDEVNETSFHIEDYEDLKKAAIDPYISIRDAYMQHRKKKVEE